MNGTTLVPRPRGVECGAVHRLALERPAHGDDRTRECPHVDPRVHSGTGDPIGAAVGERRTVGRPVLVDGVLEIVPTPSGREAALRAGREDVTQVEPDVGYAIELQ